MLFAVLLSIASITYGQTVFEIDDSGAPHKLKGELAPNFRATTLDNKEIELADLKGKIVFIDFWSLSCAACFKELPELNELARKYPADKFVLISLMDDSREELLRRFDNAANGYKMKKPVLNNDRIDFQIIPNAKEIMNLYTEQPGYPQAFIVDPSGKISYYFAGYAEERGIPGEVSSKQMFTKRIGQLLSGAPPYQMK